MNNFAAAEFPLEKKTVLLRVDFNVPIKNREVADNQKIKSSLPTILYLLQKKCKIVLATHLGRPEGKVVPELRVDPLARELQKLLPRAKIIKLNDCIGREIKEEIEKSPPGRIFLLENLRFYKEEEENDLAFAHSLSSLADIYINDAFAVSHRKHASVHAVTQFLPAVAGVSLKKEIQQLSKALHPKRPSVWIIGGAKLDKIELLNQALKKADHLLIGGALAFAFLKAKGIAVGLSKTDTGSVELAGKILKKWSARKIILPLDFIVADRFSSTAKTGIVVFNQILPQQIALDLGPKTIELFQCYLQKANTVFWNGPLGYFEWSKFAKSTKEIGRFLGKLSATTICGGGETSEALYKFHLQHGITHISSGGGAALEFLSGRKLPGIEALEENYKKFNKRF